LRFAARVAYDINHIYYIYFTFVQTNKPNAFYSVYLKSIHKNLSEFFRSSIAYNLEFVATVC